MLDESHYRPCSSDAVHDCVSQTPTEVEKTTLVQIHVKLWTSQFAIDAASYMQRFYQIIDLSVASPWIGWKNAGQVSDLQHKWVSQQYYSVRWPDWLEWVQCRFPWEIQWQFWIQEQA